MSCLTDSTIRNDFLNGTNGAIKLESTDLEILDKLYVVYIIFKFVIKLFTNIK